MDANTSRSLLPTWLMLSYSRRHCLHFASWFYLYNVLLFIVLGLNHLRTLFPINTHGLNTFGIIITHFFILINHIGYMGVLCALPFVLLILPIAILVPTKRILIPTAVLIMSFAAILFITDGFSFHLFHFHLNLTLLKMMLSPQSQEIFQLSSREWWGVGGLISTILLLQTVGAYMATKLGPKLRTQYRKHSLIVLLLCWSFSILMLMLSIGQKKNEFFIQTKIYPLYNHMLSTLFPVKNSFASFEKLHYGNFMQLPSLNKPMKYPKHPLSCTQPKRSLNIVMILIDSWRFDALNKDLTPHLQAFAPHTIQFKHHYSGGNSTQPGLFSLFYSLPANYWTAVMHEHLGPEFFKLLYRNHYTVDILASAQITVPPYHKTIFQDIHPLTVKRPGKYPANRDRHITNTFLHKLPTLAKQTQPFFTLLFYNSAHGYCEEQDFAQPYQPVSPLCMRLFVNKDTDPKPLYNRYKNAVRFIDSEVHKVLQSLKKQGLMDSTLVFITGDHGQEYNDTGLNYWEHASNFTHYQLQTPLLIHWPGAKPRDIQYQTSHYDIMPTLFQSVFQCHNSVQDYSIGYNLFNPKPRFPLLVASYINYGLVNEHEIINLYPTGHLLIQDNRANTLYNAKPDLKKLTMMIRTMRTFYRDPL